MGGSISCSYSGYTAYVILTGGIFVNLQSYLVLAVVLAFFGWALYKVIKKKGICSCGTVGRKTSDKNHQCDGQCNGCSCCCTNKKDGKK